MRCVSILSLLILAAVCALVRSASGQEQNTKPWAYQTPVRPNVAAVKHKDWLRNPIDCFILSQLESEGVKPSPEADRLTLLRRVTFDLTGLPPTLEEIAAFLADDSPTAFEKVVDRLLASPRYGERWALYWLDLVRYAESDGFRADEARPNAWRYRDYVINAFNADKPFDRFVQEQLAGDELFPGDTSALVATAFNRHVPWEHNARLLDLRRQEILNDMTDTTAQVFMGLTFGCARCHDHKYDPISQRDYYRLQAFFAAFWPREDVVVAQQDELAKQARQLQEWRAKTSELQKRMDALEEPVRQSLAHALKVKFPANVQEAWDTPADRRTPFQAQIADMLGRQLKFKRDEMAKAMKDEVRQEWQELNKQMARFEKEKPSSLPTTLGISDIGPVAPATHVLLRGDFRRKGEEVEPGFLTILDQHTPSVTPTGTTTGRRAALAKWLTHPDHPLTARVMVNRLWHHHFGRGIIGTPSDFGVLGDQPTHPELLDWLAREFIDKGWSLKAMHRLMVTSATYRQSSKFREDAAKVDPDNDLLWRMNRKRLEGETFRDALLAASGQLNLKMGGPSIYPEMPADMGVPRGGWPVTADPAERNRRSIYVFLKRNLRHPLFSTFDAPDSNEPCARRHVSTTAPQALMLLNDKTILDLARNFAGRVLREENSQAPQALVERAYRLGLSRAPDAQERAWSIEFVSQATALHRTRPSVLRPLGAPAGVDASLGAAATDLCHVLVNLNEFVYID